MGQVGMGEKLAMRNFDNLSEKIEKCLDDAAYELYQMGFDDVFSMRDSIKKVIL